MKKLKHLLLLSILFTFIYSCDSDNQDLEIEAKEVYFEGQVQGDESNRPSGLVSCGVTGVDCGSPNQTLTYTYTTSASNPSISWTINSGNITILSGQGTNTITFVLGSNFNGANITVSNNASPICSVNFGILLCGGAPNCPDPSCLNIITQPNLYCGEAQAWMNCNDPNIDYINWYYTISGSYIHQFAGTSGGNPNGQHSYPIYLPPAPNGTWEGYNLIVYANIVFNDGTVCEEIYTVVTLVDCASGGNI